MQHRAQRENGQKAKVVSDEANAERPRFSPRHVVTELLVTEQVYVEELRTIIEVIVRTLVRVKEVT